ncbi:MAG: RNase adapter RapZ [Terriglobia bacterium]
MNPSHSPATPEGLNITKSGHHQRIKRSAPSGPAAFSIRDRGFHPRLSLPLPFGEQEPQAQSRSGNKPIVTPVRHKPRPASRKRRSSAARKPKTVKQFVLITGLSGSGKGSVLKAFEDLGFYCVDNLPVDLISKFGDLLRQPGGRIDRAAVVVDIREGEALSQLPAIFQKLAQEHPRPSLVFLEASDDALIRRFEETRRPHPLGRHLAVREGIRLERMLMKPMRQLADVVISTTRMNSHELREAIQQRFGGTEARKSMLVSVMSFGFRFGIPMDADLVFDVRFLPNPNYVASLKEKTGKDRAVQKYMERYPQTREFLRRLSDMLFYLLPHYTREGKSYLTIALGCTGGRHRSVALAEQIASTLDQEGYKTRLLHRDIGRSS